MPIKLNLNLSRSKNEIPEESSGIGTVNCNGTPSTNNHSAANSHNIDVIPNNHGNNLHGHIINGNASASNNNTFLSPPKTSKFVDNIINNMDFSEQILKREYSSKSLFSLDNGKVHLVTTAKLNPQTLMRKSETVLALTNCTSSTTTTPTLSNVKTVKDRIISSSSNALNSLINSSTSKLFGFKFNNNNGNSKSSGKSTAASGIMTTNNNEQEIFVVRRSNSTAKVAPAPTTTTVGAMSTNTMANATTTAPMTPTNRLRRNWSARRLNNGIGLCSNTSLNSISCQELDEENEETIACRLCLSNVKLLETVQLQRCSCRYCRDCMTDYLIFEIQEGAYEIACPDSSCEKEGILTLEEIESLVCEQLVEKYQKFRLYREVEKDCQLSWCPTPGCETICHIEEIEIEPESQQLFGAAVDDKKKNKKKLKNSSSPSSSSSTPRRHFLKMNCTECKQDFCGECKLNYHPQEISCETYRKKLVKSGKLALVEDEEFIFHGFGSIKKCPFCHVPIEKDSGCAQMMCKRCKHVFCWYCLESLDDDFLLRHYDKGPCKNKLGHSRASIIWHRIQVVGIFTGFGILVLLASPVLILAAPCLLCCRCRYCSTKSSESELSSSAAAAVVQQQQHLTSSVSESSDQFPHSSI